jgi:hypothetical protein
MNMLHIVQEQLNKYTNARDDVSSYGASAAGYTEFVEPNPSVQVTYHMFEWTKNISQF